MTTKKKVSAKAPSMIAISSIFIPDDIPNRDAGWDKDLTELMNSIKANGQVQPILVAPYADPDEMTEYELVAGQRRIEALKNLNHTTVKVVCVASKSTKKGRFGARVAENFGRKNYTPMEEAALVKYAIDVLGLTQQEVASAFGMTAGWVSQRVSVLKQPETIQKALEDGDIAFTHVREFSRVKDEDAKEKLLKHAKREDASTFKERVNSIVAGDSPKAKPAKPADPKARKDTPLRPKKDALSMLKQLDKAQASAAKDEKKERAAHLNGIIKGVSWAYKLQGAKIKL